MTKRLKTAPDVGWLNEQGGKVTVTDGARIQCPWQCGSVNIEPAKGVEIKKDDQTLFSKPCGHCRKKIQYVLYHESVDDGPGRAFLTARQSK